MNMIFEIANYFIYKSNKDDIQDLTNKKLNKLLYYSQAWYYTLRSSTLFDNEIKAWVHGPVIIDIYRKYKKYGFNRILENVFESDFKNITPSQKEFLDEVWMVYGRKDASYLELLSHNEPPWQIARCGLSSLDNSDNNITLESMKEYYSSLLD